MLRNETRYLHKSGTQHIINMSTANPKTTFIVDGNPGSGKTITMYSVMTTFHQRTKYPVVWIGLDRNMLSVVFMASGMVQVVRNLSSTDTEDKSNLTVIDRLVKSIHNDCVIFIDGLRQCNHEVLTKLHGRSLILLVAASHSFDYVKHSSLDPNTVSHQSLSSPTEDEVKNLCIMKTMRERMRYFSEGDVNLFGNVSAYDPSGQVTEEKMDYDEEGEIDMDVDNDVPGGGQHNDITDDPDDGQLKMRDLRDKEFVDNEDKFNELYVRRQYFCGRNMRDQYSLTIQAVVDRVDRFIYRTESCHLQEIVNVALGHSSGGQVDNSILVKVGRRGNAYTFPSRYVQDRAMEELSRGEVIKGARVHIEGIEKIKDPAFHASKGWLFEGFVQFIIAHKPEALSAFKKLDNPPAGGNRQNLLTLTGIGKLRKYHTYKDISVFHDEFETGIWLGVC